MRSPKLRVDSPHGGADDRSFAARDRRMIAGSKPRRQPVIDNSLSVERLSLWQGMARSSVRQGFAAIHRIVLECNTYSAAITRCTIWNSYL